jgi:TldD protein
MKEDVAELCVNVARDLGAEYAESRCEAGLHDVVMLKNGNPETAGFDRSAGVSVRVIVNGCLGFGCTNSSDQKEIKEMVARVVKMAKASKPKKKVRLSSERASTANYTVRERRPLANVDLETKLETLMDIERAIPKNVNVPGRFLVLYTDVSARLYVNSDGARVASRIPRVGAFAVLTVLENGQTEQASLSYGKSKGWEYMKELDMPRKVADEVRMLKKLIIEGKKAPEGEVDIVVGSEVAGIIAHESCGHPFEVDRILGREAAQAGEAYTTPDMLGQRLGSDAVTIIDDPTMENNYGFYLFDDEGVKARPRYLIKKGMINEFLMNRETAAELGKMSNASARANDYDVEPIVRMSNTFFDSGDFSHDELIKDVKLGVYMKTFTEWNIDDKRFNQRYVGRECYLIENGEVKGMVRRPVLEVTTPSMFQAIDACGKNIERHSAQCGKGDPMQGIPVDLGGPELRARGIRLRSGL